MLGSSYVSAAGAFFLLVTAITFVPSKVSRKRKAIIGILHVSAHLSAALILMLLLELGIETCIRHKLLATSGECSASWGLGYYIFYFLSSKMNSCSWILFFFNFFGFGLQLDCYYSIKDFDLIMLCTSIICSQKYMLCACACGLGLWICWYTRCALSRLWGQITTF